MTKENWLKWIAVGATLFMLSGIARAAGSITVVNMGPLNSFSINTATFDGASGNIETLTFDLSGTVCGGTGCGSQPLVYGGLNSSSFAYDPGANGTSAVFGTSGSTTFGFTFTGFNPLDIFTFSWDPDTATDGNYGATVSDLVGTFITADVRIGSTLVQYSGTMGVVLNDVAANLTAPIPEPEIYAMLVAGLGFMGFVARRRKQQLAA